MDLPSLARLRELAGEVQTTWTALLAEVDAAKNQPVEVQADLAQRLEEVGALFPRVADHIPGAVQRLGWLTRCAQCRKVIEFRSYRLPWPNVWPVPADFEQYLERGVSVQRNCTGCKECEREYCLDCGATAVPECYNS